MANQRFFVNGAQVPDLQGHAHWAEEMLGPTLLTAAGEKPTVQALKGKKQVALYFSAAWCPWSRNQYPTLKSLYEKLRDVDPYDTEIVYLSTDSGKDSFWWR